jgi:hypothetical protein
MLAAVDVSRAVIPGMVAVGRTHKRTAIPEF